MKSSSRRSGKRGKKQQTIEAVLRAKNGRTTTAQRSGPHAVSGDSGTNAEKTIPDSAVRDEGKDESEEDPVVRTPQGPRNRRRKYIALSDDSGDDDSDDDVLPSTAKRRRLAPRSVPESDSSPNPEAAVTPGRSGRVRGPRAGQRSERGKLLELLRRRRNGDNISAVEDLDSSSGDVSEGHVALYDTDPENPALDRFEDDEDDDDEEEGDEERDNRLDAGAPEKMSLGKVAKSGARSAGDTGSDSNISDFIEDDEDRPMGAPALSDVGIPLEFTAQSHKPMKAYFRDALEWLAQSAINPSFERNDLLYQMAWRKLNDEFQGLATSRFSSSAWHPEFLRSLRARPYLDNFLSPRDGPAELMEKCQACNRTNHPATRLIRLTGAPYNQESLENLEQDSGSDSEDGTDRDQSGNPIARDGHEWMVGVVCAGNAETAHGLYHWKHALKDWVEDRLTSQGLFRKERLAERERLSAKKRRKLAMGIVEQWDDGGICDALWGDFKRTLEIARTKSTTGGRRRGGR